MAKKIRKENKKMKKSIIKSVEPEVSFESLSNFSSREDQERIIKDIFEVRYCMLERYSRETIRDLQKYEIERLEKEKKRATNLIQKNQETQEDMLQKIEFARKKQAEIRKVIGDLQKLYRDIENENKEIEKDIKKLNTDIEKYSSFTEEVNTILLIHPTANLTEAAKYPMAKMFVTRQDKKILSALKPDVVFDVSKETALITDLPWDFKGKYEISAEKSILAYCEMVANVKMSEDTSDANIIVLFNNEDIDEILRLNGVY